MIGQLKLPLNRSWLSCPLAMNTLLAQKQCGASVERCAEITTKLKDVQGLNFHSKIFVSPNSKLAKSQNEKAIVDFNQCNRSLIISDWLNKHGFNNYNICKYLPGMTEYALVNIAELQMPWHKSDGSHPVMTVYNSYSYTEDIKYEARLLKLPLDYTNFKLMILVPTEMDTVCSLFERLVENGVSSAVQSIQPLFTVLSDLKTPNINFYGENEFMLGKSEGEDLCLGLSMGTVKINEEGVLLKCLTCIHSQGSCQPDIQSSVNLSSMEPFLFTVMFNDMAMFTGLYVSQKN